MVEDERVGAGFGVTGRRNGVRLVASHEKKLSRCMRQKGAGRKWEFGEITQAVKLWHDSERRMGHQVDKGDISLEFKDRLNYHVLKLEAMQAKDGLDKQDQEKLGMYKAKMKIMADYTLKAERQFADRVCAKMGVKLLAPQIQPADSQ